MHEINGCFDKFLSFHRSQIVIFLQVSEIRSNCSMNNLKHFKNFTFPQFIVFFVVLIQRRFRRLSKSSLSKSLNLFEM